MMQTRNGASNAFLLRIIFHDYFSWRGHQLFLNWKKMSIMKIKDGFGNEIVMVNTASSETNI